MKWLNKKTNISINNVFKKNLISQQKKNNKTNDLIIKVPQ